MTTMRSVSGVLAAMSLAALASVHVNSQQPAVQIPQPGVPQIMTLEGKFVRVAYNNEGYVILGYQIANRTIGDEWIMLDVGITLMERVPDYTLTRDALTLDTPEGVLRLPSIEEYPGERNKSAATSEPPEGSARLDQLLSTLDARGEPSRIFCGPRVARDAMGSGRGHQLPRLRGPALLPHTWRHEVRPVLAEREVRAECRPRAIPAVHRGRGKETRQELRQHQEASRRRVPQEGVKEVAREVAARRPVSPSRCSPLNTRRLGLCHFTKWHTDCVQSGMPPWRSPHRPRDGTRRSD